MYYVINTYFIDPLTNNILLHTKMEHSRFFYHSCIDYESANALLRMSSIYSLSGRLYTEYTEHCTL